MTTVIIDYGSGNLRSAEKAFERASTGIPGAEVKVSADPGDVMAASRIVLPGVGAFRDCRDGLSAIPGMWEALEDQVSNRAKPFLGICVGMQLMATTGLEHGETPGFDWIPGKVVPIKPDDKSLKIPQMGWNTLDVRHDHPVLAGIPTGPDGWHGYFVHSYHLQAANDEDLLATTDYGGPVSAMVARGNMVGTQFHPEKSQKLGLKLIENFLRWKP